MPQLYNHFADLPALEAEKEQVINLFKEVKDGIIELNKYGIKIGATKGIKEIDELSTATAAYNKQITAQQKQIVQLTAKMAALTSEEAKKLESQKQVMKLTKDLVSSETRLTVLRQGATEKLIQQQKVNKDLAKSLELRLKIANSEKGSLDQLRAQYEKATLTINKWSQAQRDSVRGQRVIEYANQLKTKINETQKSFGNFRDNVGRYAESLADGFQLVQKEISKLQARQAELQDQQRTNITGFKIGGGENELNKVTAQLEQLDRVVIKGFNSNNTYSKSVRGIEQSYQSMAASGNFSKEFLDEFKTFAAQAKDSANDLRDEIKALSSDTRQLDLAVGSIQTLASGFEVAAGASALLGKDSEDVQRSIQKLVAIQSVANGIREIGTQITTRGTAANKAYNFVLQQGTILFGKGSTAAQRFNAALKGIIIFAVVGFLIQLVQSLTDFEDKADDAKKALSKFNDELERQKKITSDIAASDEFEFKTNIEDIKRAGEERQRLAKTEEDQLKIQNETKKQLIAEELRFRRDQLEKQRTQLEDANDQLIREEFRKNSFLRAAEEAGLKTISKERLEAYDESINKAKEYYDSLAKTIQQGQRDLILFQRQNLTEEASAEKDLANTRREKAKDRMNEEKKAALELFKFRQGLIQEQGELESSDESFFGLKDKINSAKKASEAQIKIIQAQRKFDLDEEDLTESERILINEKANKEILDSRLDLSTRIIQLKILELQKEKSLIQQSSDDFDSDVENRYKKELEIINKNNEKRVNQVERFHGEESELNAKNLSEGLITQEEYNSRKEQIEVDYQRRILESQIDFYQAQIDLLKANGEDTAELEAAIANARAQLANNQIDIATVERDKQKEIADQIRDNYINAFNQIAEAFNNVIGGIAEARKRDLDDQKEKIDVLTEAEINRINASADSEDKKVARILIAEKKAEQQKEAIERRKRQIDRQRAVFERSFKGFQIITDTIQGTNKIRLEMAAAPIPLKPLYLSQLVLAIASGAASLTSLFATPLPAYRFGTDSAEGGLSRVAEDGPELGITPSGKKVLYQEDGIYNVERGTKIYTSDVTRDILKSSFSEVKNSTSTVSYNNNVIVDNSDIVYELKQIKNRTGIYIKNSYGIESSAWFMHNFKK